jgi:hypothetical protein
LLGDDAEENLITLCASCHAWLHLGSSQKQNVRPNFVVELAFCAKDFSRARRSESNESAMTRTIMAKAGAR